MSENESEETKRPEEIESEEIEKIIELKANLSLKLVKKAITGASGDFVEEFPDACLVPLFLTFAGISVKCAVKELIEDYGYTKLEAFDKVNSLLCNGINAIKEDI